MTRARVFIIDLGVNARREMSEDSLGRPRWIFSINNGAFHRIITFVDTDLNGTRL